MNMKRKYTPITFIEYPVADGHYDTNRNPIDMIVLHSSASTRQGLINTFGGGTRMVSSHYGIDNDGSLLAFLEEYNTAYHAGNLATNRRSIGIEHIDNGADVKLHTDKQYETSAKLVADICKFYNIPIDEAHIIPHSKVTATACPNGLDVNRIINSAKQIANPTNMADQDKVTFVNELQKKYSVFYKAEDVIKYIDDRAKEIRELQDAVGAKGKELEALKKSTAKQIDDLSKEVETVQNKATADLAKKDIDCQKKMDDFKSTFTIDMDNLKEKHKLEIEELKKNTPVKEVKVETPLAERFTKKTKTQKFNAILEIISA